MRRECRRKNRWSITVEFGEPTLSIGFADRLYVGHRLIVSVTTAQIYAGQPGDRFEIEVGFHDGRRHVPIVSLRRAA